MKVVVDTNVFVSGLISPRNPPGMIINMIADGNLRICYDARILAEYRAVLERSEFNIPANRISELFAQILASGVGAFSSPLQLQLPDPSDTAFLEVALAVQSECLITGNLKHFPPSSRQGMRVFSPADFLEFYRGQQNHANGMVKSSSAKYRVSKRFKNRKTLASALRGQRKMSLTEFTRKMDSIRDARDTDWTPAEVERVIQDMRRKSKTNGTKPHGSRAGI